MNARGWGDGVDMGDSRHDVPSARACRDCSLRERYRGRARRSLGWRSREASRTVPTPSYRLEPRPGSARHSRSGCPVRERIQLCTRSTTSCGLCHLGTRIQWLFDWGFVTALDEATRFRYAQDATPTCGWTQRGITRGVVRFDRRGLTGAYGREVRSAGRLGDRAGANGRPDQLHGASRRAREGRHPGRRAPNGWKSREENVSGTTN